MKNSTLGSPTLRGAAGWRPQRCWREGFWKEAERRPEMKSCGKASSGFISSLNCRFHSSMPFSRELEGTRKITNSHLSHVGQHSFPPHPALDRLNKYATKKFQSSSKAPGSWGGSPLLPRGARSAEPMPVLLQMVFLLVLALLSSATLKSLFISAVSPPQRHS